MASSHDIPLVDRLCAFVAALPLHHLNKPVPHFLLDVHDAMLPHIETVQLRLEERGWASVSLPPYLSTLQARLAITGLVIALTIFLLAAALPRGKSGKTQKQESNVEQEAVVEVETEEVVGEVSVEKQEIRVQGKVEEVEVEREETEVELETQPVPASPRAVSVTSTSIAAVVEKPIAPVPADAAPASPPSALPTTTPGSPVSQKTPANEVEVEPRSPRPAPPTANRTSPIRTRSSTSSIPIRVPTTPARSSSYPTAINTSVNHSRHVSTPIARTATSPTSPASAKVVAASYAWVMSEGLEWDDRAGSSDETGEHSDNSASYSDDDDDEKEKDNSSPRSRRSLEDELQAAGYAGAELDGDAQYNSDSDKDNDEDDDASANKGHARSAVQDDKNSSNGALHPRRHSHTSDIEARYEAWKKTRADGVSNGGSSNKTSSSPIGSGIGGIGGIASGMGGIRKTRSHHSRKDSVLESQNNSPSNTGRSSLTMSTRSMTRHALQRKRSSALKPWARKRKEDFGEWLKKKTTNATTTGASTTKE
ncbi:uncharacterized protein J3D65DRAFT_417879 [Phyllosticta citribraziliensis]|uniref:Uncharacterized protein n=1 Tax=Phyllosticta citribraziliensis TaxID=989973 RepID=A0ABR1LMK0_9PEZI